MGGLTYVIEIDGQAFSTAKSQVDYQLQWLGVGWEWGHCLLECCGGASPRAVGEVKSDVIEQPALWAQEGQCGVDN